MVSTIRRTKVHSNGTIQVPLALPIDIPLVIFVADVAIQVLNSIMVHLAGNVPGGLEFRLQM